MGVTITFVEEDGTERTFENVSTSQSLMDVGRLNGVAGVLADCGGGLFLRDMPCLCG